MNRIKRWLRLEIIAEGDTLADFKLAGGAAAVLIVLIFFRWLI